MLHVMDRAVEEWHLPVVGKAKGRLLRRLLAARRPQRAVEVGSLFGYSAILIGGHLGRGGRLDCIEENAFLAHLVEANAARAGLGRRVRVLAGDALRILPGLRGRIDFMLIDARKEDYLRYLRAVEGKLAPGAVVVADNTGIFRDDVRGYLAHVRRPPYASREHDFDTDCMEVSVYRG